MSGSGKRSNRPTRVDARLLSLPQCGQATGPGNLFSTIAASIMRSSPHQPSDLCCRVCSFPARPGGGEVVRTPSSK